MFSTAYVSIVGSDDTGWRVLRVPAYGAPDSLPEPYGPRCDSYAMAVAQAGDVARILGIPRVLPTFCPVCHDTAEWCDVLRGDRGWLAQHGPGQRNAWVLRNADESAGTADDDRDEPTGWEP